MLKAALNEGTSNTANAAAAPMEGERHGGREELRGNKEESSLKESVPLWRDRSIAYLPTRRKDVPGAEVSLLTN